MDNTGGCLAYDEEFDVDCIGNVLRSWLDVWRPGDLRVEVADRHAFSDVPEPERTARGMIQPFGVSVFVKDDVPAGKFRIGFQPDLYDEAVKLQRWRERVRRGE